MKNSRKLSDIVSIKALQLFQKQIANQIQQISLHPMQMRSLRYRKNKGAFLLNEEVSNSFFTVPNDENDDKMI